jgi:hypothetical protein
LPKPNKQKSAADERELYAVAGPLCLQRSVLRGFVRELVEHRASVIFCFPTDLVQLRSLARLRTSHYFGALTPVRHRHAAGAFDREVEYFISTEYPRRLDSPLSSHRAEPHPHQRQIFCSLVAAIGVYVHAVQDNNSVGRAYRNYIRAWLGPRWLATVPRTVGRPSEPWVATVRPTVRHQNS